MEPEPRVLEPPLPLRQPMLMVGAALTHSPHAPPLSPPPGHYGGEDYRSNPAIHSILAHTALGTWKQEEEIMRIVPKVLLSMSTVFFNICS